MKRLIATIATVTALAAPLMLATPAHAAAPVVTITLSNPGVAPGNATTSGAQFDLGAPIANAVSVGTVVSAQLSVNYGAAAPKQYLAKWYACPTRGAALAACTAVFSGNTVNATADGVSIPYTPVAANIGTYLHFRLLVSNGNNEAGVYETAAAKDLLVFPSTPTTSRPTFATPPVPGTQTNIALGAWALGASTTFGARVVTVWSCPAASNGQNPPFGWNAQGDGCTNVSTGIASTFNTANATTIAFNTPAGTAGRFLVVSDLLTAKFGANNTLVTGAAIRSAAAAVTDAASPSPTPTVTVTATPTPAPTASPFRIAVTHRATATRGTRFKVVVSTSSAKSIGEAKVQLKKRPSSSARSSQNLRPVDVVNGTGQSVTTIGRRLARGSYYVFVTYVDDRTRKVTTTSSKVTIR